MVQMVFLQMFFLLANVWHSTCSVEDNSTLIPPVYLYAGMLVSTSGTMTSEPENSNRTTHEEAKEWKTNEAVSGNANGRVVTPVSTHHVIDNSSAHGTLTNTPTTVASATSLSLLVGGITLSFLCEPDSWACPMIFTSENDVSNQKISSMYCRCDHDCLKFGDCCPSYLARCDSLSNSQCEASAKENSLSFAETAGSHAFFDLYGTCVRDKLSIGYLVVARCPLDHLNQTVISQCQNSSVVVDKLVFSVSPRRHFVFKNKHCAICHSVGLDQQVPLTDLLACQGKSSDSAHAHTTCEMYASLGLGPAPYSFVRTCAVAWPYTMEEVENMLNSNSCTVQDKRLCRSYMFMGGTTKDFKVRNPHCSRCFSEENQDSFSQICERIKRLEQAGLSTLFGIGMNGARVRDKVEAGPSDGQPCGLDEVFDESVNVCRKLLCPKNSTTQWGKCIENLTVIIEATMQPLPLGSTELIVTFPQITDKGFVDYCLNISYGRSAIFSSSRFFCSSDQGVGDALKISSTVMDTGTFIDESQECLTCNESLLFDLGYKAFVSVKLRVRNISNVAKALLDLKEHFTTTMEVSNLCYHGNNNQSETCRGAPMRVYEDVPTRLIGSVLYGEVRTNDITRLYPLHNVIFDLVMTSTSEDMRLRRMLVCEDPDAANLLRCPLVVYNRSEAILLNNGSIWIRNTDLIYTPNQYVFNDDTVVTCDHFSNTRYFVLYVDDDDVQFYLSVACSALSVACLILTLVSYGLSKEERRNTGGKMMAALALSLLFGHCLLYVQLPSPATCFVVAAATHFVWLVVFAWMSIISASMALTFFAARSRPSLYDRPFGPFCCLALGLPAAIVITCLGLDLLQPAGFSVGYGTRTCCWIGRTEALLYFFYSPIALSVAVSFVCFVLTLYGIEVTAMVTKRLKERRQNRQRCLIYIKVFLTIGLTWAFGFVAGLTNSTAVGYIYTVANGLQGVSLFLCYTMSNRNLTHLKKHLLGFCKSSPSSSACSSSTCVPSSTNVF